MKLKTVLALLFAFGCLLAASAEIISSSRVIPWIPGTTVGVRGGIPSAAFTNSVWVFTNTEAHVQAVIDAQPSNTVVNLTNATYIIDGALTINRHHIILRGQSQNGVRLVKTNGGNGMLIVGSAVNYGTNVIIDSGFTKGSTSLVLRAAGGFSANDIAAISMLNPVHSTFHVISVAGYERLIDQRVVINSIVNGTNITFSPPLIFDFTNAPTLFKVGDAALNPGYASRHRIGVENLTLSQTNLGTGMKGSGGNMLVVANAVDCWVTGVRVDWPKNYGINVSDAVHFYYGSNDVVDSQSIGAGSNQAGLLTAYTTAGLFENSVFANRLFPAIEFNTGFNGNAIFGNFFTNNFLDALCHNSHSMMNLWEANNLDNAFEMDGYFGSASHQVLFRNAVQGTFIPILFKRWTTYMGLVGNVLGRAEGEYLAFKHDTNSVGYQILELGRPNIGNSTYIGTAPPQAWNWPGNTFSYGASTNGVYTFTNNQGPTTNLVGNFSYVPDPVASAYPVLFQDGSNTNRYFTSTGQTVVVSVSAGTTTNLHVNTYVAVSTGDRLFIGGQTAYQQLQLTNVHTDVIHGNYDYFNNGIVWATNIADHTLPVSLIYSNGAPLWWGTNRWPAIDPEASSRITVIPAQNRYNNIDNGGPAPSVPRTVRGLKVVVGQLVR